MGKVKNNHDAPLSIAGVVVGPGKTVSINSNALRSVLDSNGVKTWLKLKLIEIDEQPSIPGLPVTREQLESRATELGIEFQASTRDSTLVRKISEAEALVEGTVIE